MVISRQLHHTPHTTHSNTQKTLICNWPAPRGPTFSHPHAPRTSLLRLPSPPSQHKRRTHSAQEQHARRISARARDAGLHGRRRGSGRGLRRGGPDLRGGGRLGAGDAGGGGERAGGQGGGSSGGLGLLLLLGGGGPGRVLARSAVDGAVVVAGAGCGAGDDVVGLAGAGGAGAGGGGGVVALVVGEDGELRAVLEDAGAVFDDEHAVARGGGLSAGGEGAGYGPGVGFGVGWDSLDDGGRVGDAVGGVAAAEDKGNGGILVARGVPGYGVGLALGDGLVTC